MLHCKLIKLSVLILTVVILLCGCASKLPNGVTQSVYDYGVKTVEICDKYFVGEMSRDDAKTQMIELVNSYSYDRATDKSERNISLAISVSTSNLKLTIDTKNAESVRLIIHDKRDEIAWVLS